MSSDSALRIPTMILPVLLATDNEESIVTSLD